MFRNILAATVVIASATVVLMACSDSPTAEPAKTFTGSKIAVGQGTAWTEMTVGQSNAIQEVSLVFTEDALVGLPGTAPATEFVIPLPSDAPGTVFNHVGVNWQPQGHPPATIYSVPHFDVHFYLISTQERDAMTPADPNFAAKALKVPATNLVPVSYGPDPMPIPRMGSHWGDGTSHEFHGSAFTATMIYGYYDGKMTFIEPMLAKSFIESKPNYSATIRTPAAYPKAGRYPTTYGVTHTAAAKEYRVKLGTFVARN
ncbi:MAG: DUF5602 domain-containing protein [Phycisphaerae bacterium]|nr:DUF5602 domain-containing protein [Gemmatimonadaceae bacterium]